MTSPTQRTLQLLRKQGAICGIVEKWNQFARIRQDLFQFIDIICLKDNAIIGIQCTSGANHAARKAKILENKIAPYWIKAGGKIWLISFSKKKIKRGGKAYKYVPRIEVIKLSTTK